MPAEPRDRKGCGTGVTISRGNKRGAKVSTAAMHGGCFVLQLRELGRNNHLLVIGYVGQALKTAGTCIVKFQIPPSVITWYPAFFCFSTRSVIAVSSTFFDSSAVIIPVFSVSVKYRKKRFVIVLIYSKPL